jgi:enamine deaminase RidA (YjgF/YER057c/UK114 family)
MHHEGEAETEPNGEAEADAATPALTVIDPPELARPSGYAHGVLAPPGARILFVAGQIGWDGRGRLVGAGFLEQLEQALANVVAVVRAAGGGPEHLARLTLYVTDKREYLRDLPAIGRAYRRVMGRHYPAMALVEVAALVEDGAWVEIEATAALPPAAAGVAPGTSAPL